MLDGGGRRAHAHLSTSFNQSWNVFWENERTNERTKERKKKKLLGNKMPFFPLGKRFEWFVHIRKTHKQIMAMWESREREREREALLGIGIGWDANASSAAGSQLVWKVPIDTTQLARNGRLVYYCISHRIWCIDASTTSAVRYEYGARRTQQRINIYYHDDNIMNI